MLRAEVFSYCINCKTLQKLHFLLFAKHFCPCINCKTPYKGVQFCSEVCALILFARNKLRDVMNAGKKLFAQKVARNGFGHSLFANSECSRNVNVPKLGTIVPKSRTAYSM